MKYTGLFLSGILIFLAYIPIIRNYQRVPTDRLYYGGEEYPLDMTGNLSYVQQGYNGHVLSFFNYSTRLPNQASLLKFEYLAIGHLARIFRLDPILMFQITRFILGILFLLTIAVIIRSIFASSFERTIAYLLVLFATGFVPLSSFPFDSLVFERIMLSMPHYVIGAIGSLLSVYFLAQVIEGKGSRVTFVASLLFGIVASFSYSPDIVFVVLGLPVVISLILWKKFAHPRYLIGLVLVWAVVVVAPIAYVRLVWVTAWQQILPSHMEALNPLRLTPLQYLAAVGSGFLFSIVALPRVLKKNNVLLFVFASWLILHPVGEFFLSDIMGINRVRFFLTPYYVAFGILGTIGIITVSQKRRLVALLLTTLVLASGFTDYVANWKRANLCFCIERYRDYGYPKRTLVAAMNWLKTNTQEHDVVLSDYFTGTLLPGFSGNAVYVSWWYRLIDPPDRHLVEVEIGPFYKGEMSQREARDFLGRERISYVFYGEVERALNNDKVENLPYAGLVPVYNRDMTTIYEVRQ